MEESSEIVIESKKKTARRKYIIASVIIFLCICAGSIDRVITWEPKPDPASEKVIREAAARQLTTDPNNPIEPNELTDEDFEQIKILRINPFESALEYSLRIKLGLVAQPRVAIKIEPLCISNLRMLEKFPNLKELVLSGISYPRNKIPKWMMILERIGFLNLKNIDLKPLENLTNLRVLTIYNSEINNIEPLKYLTNLEELDASFTKVSNLKSLRNLTKLKSLNLSNTQVSDLEPLRELKNLQDLFITKTPVSNLEPLKNFKNLKFLFLNDCPNISNEQVEELQKALPNLDIRR